MQNQITIPANKLGKLLSLCTQNQLNPTSTVKITEDETKYKLLTRQQGEAEFTLAAYTKKHVQQSTAAGG